MLKVYTDGACSGNPGPGGWGYVYVKDGNNYERSGGSPDTTNNRMELTAAIRAIQELGPNICIMSDSTYVVTGITKWIINWRKKDFHKIKNPSLWKELDSLSTIDTKWKWVKAHNGDKFNEIADQLAVSAIPR